MQKSKNKKISKLRQIFDPRMFFYDIVKWTGGPSAILFFRQKRTFINGKKPHNFYKGSSIIIANHHSFLDPLIVSNAYWPKRCAFIATSELFKNKFRKILFNAFGCIEVNKENVSVSTFKKTAKMLQYGHCVIVFPDGGIVKENANHTFKSGAVMMALMGDAPIIPMYIVKRDKWWKRQHVMVGEKLYVKDYIKSPIPSLDEINNVTKILEEKEFELEQLSKKGVHNANK